jgi:hypothetical protein
MRINHHWSKCEEDWSKKLALWESSGRSRQPDRFRDLEKHLNAVRDDAIKLYLPALRKAIETVGSSSRRTPAM